MRGQDVRRWRRRVRPALLLVTALTALMMACSDDGGPAAECDLTPDCDPGHVCIDLNAPGGHAVLSGDTLHHPIQVAYPEWNSRFCVDPDLARISRRDFVDRHADTDAWILAAHFASPSFGRIVANGERCKFQL